MIVFTQDEKKQNQTSASISESVSTVLTNIRTDKRKDGRTKVSVDVHCVWYDDDSIIYVDNDDNYDENWQYDNYDQK